MAFRPQVPCSSPLQATLIGFRYRSGPISATLKEPPPLSGTTRMLAHVDQTNAPPVTPP